MFDPPQQNVHFNLYSIQVGTTILTLLFFLFSTNSQGIDRNTPSPQQNNAAAMAGALAALQGQMPLNSLLMPNMGLANIPTLSPTDMLQALQQVQQAASLQQQLQSYMELFHGNSGMNTQKTPNLNNVQVAAQIFQVNSQFASYETFIRLFL